MSANLIPGMVSVTFRSLTPKQIIDTVYDNGLKAIEWGSDVHVPMGNEIAKEVSEYSAQKGILPVSYGSYHGKGESGFDAFSKLVSSAKMLGTDNIRIWAGAKDSEDVTPEERKAYVKEVQTLAEIAQKDNISVSFECHGSTLTNKPDSAVRLIEEIARDNVYLYWQPLQSADIELNKRIIKQFMPYLKNVHVYAWKGLERFSLLEHEKAWREYIDVLSQSNKTHALLLEFVKDDSLLQLTQDSQALLDWLK